MIYYIMSYVAPCIGTCSTLVDTGEGKDVLNPLNFGVNVSCTLRSTLEPMHLHKFCRNVIYMFLRDTSCKSYRSTYDNITAPCICRLKVIFIYIRTAP